MTPDIDAPPEYETTVAEGHKAILTDRPAEAGGFVLLVPAVYGALTQIDVPAPWSWIIAVLVATVPFVISSWRDGKPELGDPGDHDSETGPTVKKGKHEKVGLEHNRAPA